MNEQKNLGLCNTGSCNTGNCNTGSRNTGSCNTGSRNTGDWNIGDWNIGDWNTGDRNTGDCNTGSCNTGSGNTGSRNTGSRNTGDWNRCGGSTGFFNTKERTVSIFNKDSELTYSECLRSDWYRALNSVPFILTEWVDYTEEEKKESIIRQCIGGYLKKYSFQEACANWWKRMSKENKSLIQTIPNFDKDIFMEITGIDVEC